jgi:uncharacterized protein (DUF433 family)
MKNLKNRISVNPDQCGGRPCIRGLRIKVVDILDLLASGLTQKDVLAEFPDLEEEDIVAALKYARGKIDHPVVSLINYPADELDEDIENARRHSI